MPEADYTACQLIKCANGSGQPPKWEIVRSFMYRSTDLSAAASLGPEEAETASTVCFALGFYLSLTAGKQQLISCMDGRLQPTEIAHRLV